MNTINERIKTLRKVHLNMTQVEFGNRIGVSGVAVTNWEKDRRQISEVTIKTICNEFDVNYAWLKDGKGDIFNHSKKTLIDQLCKEYDLNDIQRRIIEAVLTLTDDQINDFTRKFFGFEAIKKNKD